MVPQIKMFAPIVGKEDIGNNYFWLKGSIREKYLHCSEHMSKLSNEKVLRFLRLIIFRANECKEDSWK